MAGPTGSTLKLILFGWYTFFHRNQLTGPGDLSIQSPGASQKIPKKYCWWFHRSPAAHRHGSVDEGLCTPCARTIATMSTIYSKFKPISMPTWFIMAKVAGWSIHTEVVWNVKSGVGLHTATYHVKTILVHTCHCWKAYPPVIWLDSHLNDQWSTCCKYIYHVH